MKLPIVLSAIIFCGMSSFSQALTLDSLLKSHIELRFGVLMHFNMNTYSPGWGNDRVNPQIFNPTGLNCAQWAASAKAAGMKYGVLTAKHHDGFTIWPSQQTPPNGKVPYTIAQSSTPTLDVVKSYTDAFRAAGLLPGLYFSMWDVANGITGWSTAERTFVLGQLTELLNGAYGQIPILMIDGYDWKMGHKTIPYQQIRDTVKKMQPNCLLTDMNGLMSPWECDIIFVEEPKGLYCPSGNTFAACQSPTISNGWFWDNSAASAGSLMSLSTIISHLNTLEPRYCNLLLNCPPNRSGVFDAALVTRLAEVGAAWKPNASRAPLPAQMANIEHPITPVSATASSGTAANTIDGFSDCASSTQQAYCTSPSQTLWTAPVGVYVTLDLGSIVQNIGILGYLPSANSTTGAITGYTISTSINNTAYTQVASGTWPVSMNYRTVTFAPTAARYVRLTATAASGGSTVVASEIDVGVTPATPITVNTKGKHVESPPSFATATYRTIGEKFVIPVEYAGKALDIAVFDLSGKPVREATIEKNALDLSEGRRMPGGLYIVKIKLKKGSE